jgi:RimJ/RimL family protein N-acetyltransferase
LIRLRPSLAADIPFITALERHPDNREQIGQWTDEQHLAAIEGREGWSHWVIERDGRPAGYMIPRDCRAGGAGVYLKRILVADKERGTGQAALEAFVDRAFAEGAGEVWLIVRDINARAQAVYGKLGFEKFDPDIEEAAKYDALGEPPMARSFRMRLRR